MRWPQRSGQLVDYFAMNLRHAAALLEKARAAGVKIFD
jgi:hypothetical protein